MAINVCDRNKSKAKQNFKKLLNEKENQVAVFINPRPENYFHGGPVRFY